MLFQSHNKLAPNNPGDFTNQGPANSRGLLKRAIENMRDLDNNPDGKLTLKHVKSTKDRELYKEMSKARMSQVSGKTINDRNSSFVPSVRTSINPSNRPKSSCLTRKNLDHLSDMLKP